MKFLAKLKSEGKLILIENSVALSDSYLFKSQSNLTSAKILLASNQLEESVTLAYYSMYNCLLALLFRCGIKSENHGASIMLLDTLFNEKELAAVISYGKKERIDKQYYVDFSVTRKDAEEMIKKTEEFVLQCRIILDALTAMRIQQFRDAFGKLIS